VFLAEKENKNQNYGNKRASSRPINLEEKEILIT
jgi:hypothetical protein